MRATLRIQGATPRTLQPLIEVQVLIEEAASLHLTVGLSLLSPATDADKAAYARLCEQARAA